MPTVRIPTKLSRNAPCHCGSGRKYKKCCEKKEKKAMEAGKQIELKNEFREEVQDPYAGIPEIELVRRDQAVLLKELILRKMVRAVNNFGIRKIIDSAKELRIEITALPKSPYREVCIDNLGKMIENNQQVLDANKLPIETALTLLALEELFAGGEDVETKDVSARNSDGSPYQAAKIDSSEGSEAEETDDDTPKLAEEAI